jgi:hypothetical protein
MEVREPTVDELRLLSFLGQHARPRPAASWLTGLRVEELSDGGMRSLSLYLPDMAQDRTFGRTLAACQFEDRDGVSVVASLYANREGCPFELDMWRVDFKPLQRIAEHFTLLDE